MLLTVGAVICINSIFSLHFNWPQWGEEIPGGNFRLQIQLGIADSHGGCCRLLCSFAGVVCR
jgi:hypothetical protein